MRGEPLSDLSHMVGTEQARNGASQRPRWVRFLDRALGAVIWGILAWFGLMVLGGLAKVVVGAIVAGWTIGGRILGI